MKINNLEARFNIIIGKKIFFNSAQKNFPDKSHYYRHCTKDLNKQKLFYLLHQA
jgi:hypothetical protein